MRPVWKWILGIIIVVILLCGVAAVGAFAFYRLGGIPWIMNARAVTTLLRRASHPTVSDAAAPERQAADDALRSDVRIPFWWLIPLGVFRQAAVLPGLSGAACSDRSRCFAEPETPAGTAPAAVGTARGCTTEVASHPRQRQRLPRQQPAAARAAGVLVNEDWSHCPYCGSPLS